MSNIDTRNKKNIHAEEFKKRKKIQWLITIAGLLWFVLLCFIVIVSGVQVKEDAGLAPTPIGYGVTIVVSLLFILPVIYLTQKNWRCPACGKPLGRSINPKSCPACKQSFS